MRQNDTIAPVATAHQDEEANARRMKFFESRRS